MLFWYWALGALGGFLTGAVNGLVFGHPWNPERSAAIGLAISTAPYFIHTLGSGIDNAIKLKTWRVYPLWDATAFVVVGLVVLFGYMEPRDRSPSEGMTWGMSISLYLNSLYIFIAAYFVCWLVLRWLFRPRMHGIASY